jgi:hypothetical protein
MPSVTVRLKRDPRSERDILDGSYRINRIGRGENAVGRLTLDPTLRPNYEFRNWKPGTPSHNSRGNYVDPSRLFAITIDVTDRKMHYPRHEEGHL